MDSTRVYVHDTSAVGGDILQLKLVVGRWMRFADNGVCTCISANNTFSNVYEFRCCIFAALF